MSERSPFVALYRVLLRLLPREMRAANGDDMVALVLDLHDRCRARRGRWAAALFLLRSCFELLPLAIVARTDKSTPALPPRRDKLIPKTFDVLRAELQYGSRTLRREPGYALAFIVTLGLGIGVNTAIFSVVNGVLLRPLPYPHGDRLVYLTQPVPGSGARDMLLSLQEVADLRARATTLDKVVEFGDIGFIVQAGAEAHRAMGGLVSPEFFDVLGMSALAGRTLRPGDFGPDATPVAVLTHEYWQRAFGADPGVVGRMIDLTDERAEIVGVLQPGVHYAGSTGAQDFYLNYRADDHYRSAAMQDDRTHRMTTVLARLTAGSRIEQANAELASIVDGFAAAHPDAYPDDWGATIRLTPWKEYASATARPTLYLLLGTAGFVLLAATANVANLMLMRMSRRRREIGVRAALGAGRARLRGLLLAESLLLTTTGALSGLLVAALGIDVLVPYVARFTHRTGEIGIDGWVLGFALGVAFASAVLFALVPRIGSAPEGAVAGGGRSTAGGRRRHTHRALVVAQFALSFVLLVGAGLTIRTLVNLYEVDPGFDLENVLRVDAPKFVWRTNRAQGAEERREFSDALIAELTDHPLIESAAIAAAPPLQGGGARPQRFEVDGAPPAVTEPVSTFSPMVSGGYFATLGIELLRGRTFDPLIDVPDGVRAAVIDASMARHYFADADPIGRRIGPEGSSPGAWFTVVGVVADSRLTGLEAGGVHTLYRSETQGRSPFTILVRTRAAPGAIAPHVVDTIRRLDPQRPVENIESLAAIRAEYMAPQRLNARLFGMLAALALAIAAVGLAGTLGFSVAERRREIGIRLALGAGERQVVGLVVREGTLLAVLGLLIGAVAALPLSRFVASLLYAVEPIDPLSLAFAAAFLMIIGVAACWFPARRAAAVQPEEALRGS